MLALFSRATQTWGAYTVVMVNLEQTEVCQWSLTDPPLLCNLKAILIKFKFHVID